MSDSTIHSTVAELVKSFANASPDRLESEYRRLVGGLWNGGAATDLARQGTPVLVEHLDLVDTDRQGYLAILLGLLAETGDADVFTAVHAGLGRYLDLVGTGAKGEPLTLAFLYLLSHFPADREAVLAAVAPLNLDADDQTRLERALARLDPAKPDLGRVWPSPSVWVLDENEKDFTAGWIKSLTPEQIESNWNNDTLTVLGYTGARAYWSVANNKPASTLATSMSPEDAILPEPTGQSTAVFAKHVESLRCPTCHGGLEFSDNGVRCPKCATGFAIANGILDLSAGVREDQEADDATNDLLQKLAEMPSMGLYYEAVLRPAYLRIAGSNWGDQVSPTDEDEYIASHVRPVDGPVLDLAAGAGRWTKIVAKAVGADRLIALDMALPMLNVLRGALPEVPAVKASALNLPFSDGSLGAVNCWNALQAFPDDAREAILEMGRVLKPGGSLTMMTFKWSADLVARHFQECQYFPSRPEGHLLFELDELHAWFAEAGLSIVEESAGEGTFVFLTAERQG